MRGASSAQRCCASRHMLMSLVSPTDHRYELGPGKVLAGIMKRINKKKQIINIEV